ncbi:MAG: dephospho-CoA kinase [Spirochaetaceae bacterium]|jgi:dephospho-CoA kinase|nr:dephospho-CoA kinase [Spirochaetaceae bacterium]
MLAGVTGLYCAGKNHVAALLSTRGALVLDVDKLGWRVLDEKHAEITARWGGGIVDSGKVNRVALAKKVFTSGQELKALEDIIHPAVNTYIEKWIKENGESFLIINAALIHKTEIFSRLDFLIVVEAPLVIRVLRARKRDKLDFCGIARRFMSQKTFALHYSEKKTDIYTIKNGGFGVFTRIARRSLEKQLDALPGLARFGGSNR